MGWIIASCFVVGAVCASRIPVLIFALIVLCSSLIVFGASSLAGGTAWSSIGYAVLVAVVLEAGYVAGHLLLYLYFSRHAGRSKTRSDDKSQSSRDSN